MTDTPARQASADFVNYFSAGTSIVVRRGNPAGVLELGDLCGSTVAVERGTVQVDLIARAQARCGSRPVQVRVFPNADHGIIRFVQQEDGERRFIGIEPDYYPAQIAWLREHSGS